MTSDFLALLFVWLMRQLAPGEKRRFFLEPLRESVGEVPETFSGSNVTSGSEREEQTIA